MPARPRDVPPTFADAYAATAQHLQSELGDSLAAQAGPPTSVEVTPVSDRQKADAWNTPHPAATDDAMWQLAQQKYAEHRQAGLPEDKAVEATSEDLTHFRYRARQPLYTLGTTSWDEQVLEAKRLSKLAAKQTPEPQPAASPPAAAAPAALSAPVGAPGTPPGALTGPPGAPGPAAGLPPPPGLPEGPLPPPAQAGGLTYGS